MFQNPPGATAPQPMAPQPMPADMRQACDMILWQKFGHKEWRSGQLETIAAVMQGRDASIILATGGGMCYQIPAILTRKIVVVVSPLISLMQDQCRNINNQMGGEFATYLSPSNPDHNHEQRARNGEFFLVYTTPEKIAFADTHSNTGVFQAMQRNKGIALVAIDEAHCVCEWGNDFRKDYQDLGRIRDALPGVPVVALTATAVPRIRQDITRSLRLNNPFCFTGDFSRPNLSFSARPKQASGAEFAPLVEEIGLAIRKGDSPDATIIYCPTTKEVDDIHGLLETLVKNGNHNFDVLKYHAKLGQGERRHAHEAFKVGIDKHGRKCPVLVATVAFGMGIDKPDVRRVIHYGSPTTLEAYYQQAGRAGRDGNPAVCQLYYTSHEFVTYKTAEFYRPPDMNPQHREFLDQSVDALRAYAESTTQCRMQMLVRWFGDTCERCEQCDNCQNGGMDNLRDLTADASMIINCLRMGGGTTITKLVEEIHSNPHKKLAACTTNPSKKFLQDFTKELVAQLKEGGWLSAEQRTMTTGGGFKTGYELVRATGKALPMPFMGYPPRCMQAEEAKVKARADKIKKELSSAGVDISKIPAKELKEGAGPTVQMEMKYQRWIKGMTESDNPQRVEKGKQVQDLLRKIHEWRQNWALQLQIAPAAFLNDHVCRKVVYVGASGRLDQEGLKEQGVRGQAVPSLQQLVAQWQDETGILEVAGGEEEANKQVVFPAAGWKPTPFPNAPKLSKVIQTSYDLFVREGKTLSAIAMARDKPVQPDTILGHLCTAAQHGLPLPWEKLGSYFPSESKWKLFMDEVSDVEVQDPNSDRYQKPMIERMNDAVTYSEVRFFLMLRRVNFPMEFQRVGPRKFKACVPHGVHRASAGAVATPQTSAVGIAPPPQQGVKRPRE